jgi:hypothetical protein
LVLKPDDPTRYLELHQRENTMIRSTKNSVLDRGARQRGARSVAGSRLHELYAAPLAEPLPAELRDLVAQLVALEAGTKKSSERPVGVWQLAPLQPGWRG